MALGCGRTGKQFEPVRCRGRGFGGQDEARRAGVGGKFQSFIAVVELPDGGVVRLREADAVEAHTGSNAGSTVESDRSFS